MLWLENLTIFLHALNYAGFGYLALTGMPLTLAAMFLKCFKK